MDNDITFQEELLGIIGKLDYTWYSDIKRLYEKVYDPKIKKAKIIVPGYCRGYDPETGKDCDDEIIYCGIKEYCWEYDYERIRSAGDESPVEGWWVASVIEQTIAQYIKDLPLANLNDYQYSDIDIQKNDLVAGAYSIIRTKIIEYQSVSKDPEYSAVLTYILLRLRHNLYSHYGHFREKAKRVKRIEDFMLGKHSTEDNPITTQIPVPPLSESIPEPNKVLFSDPEPSHFLKQDRIDYREDFVKSAGLYENLKEVFVNADAYNEAIEALKKGEGRIKPVISANNEYLLGPRMKGSIVGWIELLKIRGRLKTITNIELTAHLNNEIKGLNIYPDGSILSETATSHARNYYSFFGKLIK